MKNIHANKIENPENRTDNRVVFTGEALFTVEAVNPTKDEIVKIKGLENIADRIEDPQYTDILLKQGAYTKIEFLLSFEPSLMLKPENVKSSYPEKLFVPYPIFINKELSLNKNGTKCQVIDDHNESAWIPYTEGISAAEALTKALEASSDSEESYLSSVDVNTVRWALKGEVLLYSFLFNMTTLSRHNPENGKELSGFVLGGDPKKASEVFKKIVDGDFKPIKEIIGSSITQYTDGKVAKVGGLLGVRINDANKSNIKFYQEIFNNPMDVCTFRESYKGGEKRGEHVTRLSKGAYERLTHPEYGWKHEWNNSMEFQEYDRDSYVIPDTNEDGDDHVDTSNLPF